MRCDSCWVSALTSPLWWGGSLESGTVRQINPPFFFLCYFWPESLPQWQHETRTLEKCEWVLWTKASQQETQRSIQNPGLDDTSIGLPETEPTRSPEGCPLPASSAKKLHFQSHFYFFPPIPVESAISPKHTLARKYQGKDASFWA